MSQEPCAPASGGTLAAGITYTAAGCTGTAWPPLNAHDRCDACGAAARVRVARHAQDMVWCGHHWTAHKTALISNGWLVVEAP